VVPLTEHAFGALKRLDQTIHLIHRIIKGKRGTASRCHAIFGQQGLGAWDKSVEPRIEFVPDIISFDKALVFEKAKDKPVLISALAANADVLLTLDRTDFHRTLGTRVYSLLVRTPAEFLMEQRNLGRI
jgi:hypothetical protein